MRRPPPTTYHHRGVVPLETPEAPTTPPPPPIVDEEATRSVRAADLNLGGCLHRNSTAGKYFRPAADKVNCVNPTPPTPAHWCGEVSGGTGGGGGGGGAGRRSTGRRERESSELIRPPLRQLLRRD